LVLLTVLAAAAFARPGRPALLGGAACALFFALVGGIEALVNPYTVLRPCRPDNPCGVLGILFAGVFTNENIFSLLLIVGIPFVWLGLRGRVRVVLASYVAFMAVASGSTLASVTAVVTLAFLTVMRPRLADESEPDRAAASPGRLLLAVPVLGGAAAAGLLFPFHPPGAVSLTDRATIWAMARDELRDSALVGFGGKAWSAKYQLGEIPAAVSPSLHNEWIDILYAGGLLGLGLFLLLLVHLLVRGGVAGLPVMASVLLPVLLASILERPWSFGISNSLTFALMVATITPVGVLARARSAARPAVPASGPRPAARLGRMPRH
jgi:hypothetical protein